MSTEQPTLSDKQKIDQIKERLEFFSKNPKVPAVFRFNKPGASNISNAQDSSIYNSSETHFPNDINVEYASEEGGMKEQHRIVYDGGANIHTGWERYKNATSGAIELPRLAMLRYFGNSLVVHGDNAKGLRLIEFLSYVDFFYPKNLVEFVTNTITKPEEVDKTTLTLELVDTINKMAESDEGYNYLIKMAKNPKINPKATQVEALLHQDGAKKQIVSLLHTKLLANPLGFNALFLPFDDEKKLVNAAKEKNIIGFNTETSAYQLKDTGGSYVSDGVLYSTKVTDKVVGTILLYNEIKTNNEVKEKLSLYLK